MFKHSQEECSTVDVASQNPKLKEYFSYPLDQDSIGWCYAYAASDLLTVEAGEPVSPVHVGAIFNKKVSNSNLWKLYFSIHNTLSPKEEDIGVYEGGYIKSAIIDTMKNEKVCSYKNLPYFKGYGTKIRSLVKFLELQKQKIAENKISEEKACKIIKDDLEEIFPNQIDDKIVQSIVRDDLNLALEQLVSSNCSNSYLPLKIKGVRDLTRPHLQVKEKRRNENKLAERDYLRAMEHYKDKINSVLTAGKPMGLTYNLKHVTKTDGYHASTVMGRQWRNGRCEFKIRNSWGTSCEYYNHDMDCTRGSFWVSDEKFFDMALNLTFIDG